MELDLNNSVIRFNNSSTPFVVDGNGVPWFRAKDLALSLGYVNPGKAIRDHVPDRLILRRSDIVENVPVVLSHNERNTRYLKEAGLYRLALKSRTPQAERFCDWVVEEVLPSIRETSRYNGL